MNNGADDAARWLDEQAKAMEQALAELVEVNSFTENVEGGRKVGAMLEELFAIEGLESRRVASTKFADHLVVSSRAPGLAAGSRRSRSSVTSTPCSRPALFEGYRRDGDLARGPGVLDMKGGLVVVAWALKALAQAGALARCPASASSSSPTRRSARPRARASSRKRSKARAARSSSRRAARTTSSSRAARGPAR